MKRGSALAIITAMLVVGCTFKTYTGYGEIYDQELRERVFDRYDAGDEAAKARSMRAALAERRDALRVTFSAAFFEDLGFTCSGAQCSITVQKFLYRTARPNLPYDVRLPEGFGDVSELIVDRYDVRYTPTSVAVNVTSRSETYGAP